MLKDASAVNGLETIFCDDSWLLVALLSSILADLAPLALREMALEGIVIGVPFTCLMAVISV